MTFVRFKGNDSLGGFFIRLVREKHTLRAHFPSTAPGTNIPQSKPRKEQRWDVPRPIHPITRSCQLYFLNTPPVRSALYPHHQKGLELTLTDPQAIMMLNRLFPALALSAGDTRPGFKSQLCHGVRNRGTVAYIAGRSQDVFNTL